MMKYKLQDLIDIEHFQNIQDRLNKIYSFPSSIIDNDGKILTATAWQDVCTKFHRKNKECERDCIKSDQYILDHLNEANPAVSYKCPRGLVDNAMPIIIDGIHYGNFFTGQFFLEKPDLELFRTQAKKYGFNENAYIEAVEKVPIWTQEQLDNYLLFIKGLISVISESGLKTLKEIENRKKIEKKEELHRSILETAMDGFWIADTQGHLLEVNDAYCKMSGYSSDELLSMRIDDIDVDEKPQDVANHINEVKLRGTDRFESRHRRKDGSIFDVEVSVQFRSGEEERCIAFLRDITERKRAEAALRESETQNRSVLSTINEGVILQDASGKIITWNRGAEDIFGISSKNVLGQTTQGKDWATIHEDGTKYEGKDHPSMRTLQTGNPFRNEIMGVYQPSGALRWISINTNPLFAENCDKPYAVAISFSDITTFKLAMTELNEKDKALRLSLDAAKAGTWTWDVNSGEVVWDEMMQRIFGLEPGTFDGTFEAWKKRVDPEDVELAEEITLQALKSGSPYEHEYRVKGLSGEWRVVNAQAATLFNKDKEPIRMSGFASDITERKLNELALKESENRFRQLVENLQDLVVKFDKNHSIIYASPNYCSMFGKTEDELVGGHFKPMIHADDLPAVEASLATLFDKPYHTYHEERAKTIDGWRWFGWSAKAVLNDEGKLEEIISVGRDITEQKASDSAMRAVVESTAGLVGQDFFETVVEKICDWLECDVALVGELQEGGIVSTLAMLVNGENIHDFKYSLQNTPCEAVMREGYCFYPENIKDLFPKDKDLVELNAEGYVGTPLRNNENQPIGVLNAISRKKMYLSKKEKQGLTIIAAKVSAEIERYKADEKLQKQSHFLQKAQEIGKIGTWELDVQKNNLLWTDENYRIFGVPLGANLTYETFLNCVHPDDRAYVDKEWTASFSGKPMT